MLIMKTASPSHYHSVFSPMVSPSSSSSSVGALSQSTSSSSSSRQTIASSSTTSKHPLPARPDWAVGMKPSSHRPQNGSLPGLARHSPRRTPNQQLSPMSLQPGDFPPLTIHNVNANGHGNNGPLNAEKRLPTASNVWNNQDSTRAVLTMGNAPPLPPNHHPYGQHPPGPLPPPHLQHPQYQPQHYPPPPDHQLMNGNPNARPQGYLSHPPPPVPLQTQGYGHPSHPSPHAHAPPPPPPPHQHQYQQHQQQPQAAPFQGRPTRLDEYDARFERPPPKGGTGLYNPKAGNNGSNQSINQQVHVQQRTVNPNANASSSVQSPSQPQPQPHPGPPAHPQHQHHAHSYTNGVGRAGANEKIAENARESVQRELERVRSESVASAILVNGVGGMSINEGMPGAAGVEGGADRS
ncbi:hypothetical protein SISSUDRAFT_293027 [Sistotremastrum suecicum HHB10207 ss-3]|uniref:Uncharacterized protein n=1 Tax=Sistotremastrum suecicum HHB10207 ss-3 TaxID=1314776 RepID=A0A165ZJA2_9AGAM|nr:hypothetical protein SISSUDRAFT_293027 [Sistotremastrum suecicum HHB10207 ss-3]